MASPKNYYSIHKNKTKRKKVSRKLSSKTIKAIAFASKLVYYAMKKNSGFNN